MHELKFLKSIKGLFILLFFSQISFAQTYSSLIDDNEIINFINSRVSDIGVEKELKTVNVSTQVKSWVGSPYLFHDLIDSIFSRSDSAFVIEQINSIHKDNFFRKKDLYNVKQIKHISSKPGGKYAQYAFSIPLFSTDRRKLIIKELYYCAYSCSVFCIKLFEKDTEENWKFKTTLIEETLFY